MMILEVKKQIYFQRHIQKNKDWNFFPLRYKIKLSGSFSDTSKRIRIETALP